MRNNVFENDDLRKKQSLLTFGMNYLAILGL